MTKNAGKSDSQPDATGPTEGKGGGAARETALLDLSMIEPNPHQARRFFNDDELERLAESMAAVGQLQPVLVKRRSDRPDRYLLVAGERRWRAAAKVGLPRIAAHILPADADADQVALIENLQRVNLSPVEEAEGVKRLMDRHNYNQEETGALLGRSRTEINTSLSLLRLHPSIRAACATSHTEIPKAVLLELARMAFPAQLSAWEEARDGGLTVREARAQRLPRDEETSSVPRRRLTFSPQRFIAGLTKVQQGLDSGLSTLDLERPALSPEEVERLHALRRRLDAYGVMLDRILSDT
jgi:ParB family transcriptional regulator, chromosome partitioning protein